MTKSMTAYGRASESFPFGRIDVEIQTVNRKHLEINVSLPPFLLKHDADIKRWIGQKISRGQINVKVNLIAEAGSPVIISPNRALAQQLKTAWDKIAEDLGIQIDDASYIKILLQQEGLLNYSEQTENPLYDQALHQVIHLALDRCIAMKAKEGANLQQDILERLHLIDKDVQEVALRAHGASERYREKLLQRIQESFATISVDDERLLREVALFAEKVDVSEEITRLRSHLQQSKALLIGTTQPKGKTFDFIVQEMNREANTMGSKCLDVEVSRYVIDIKSEVERIREQIQNIE